MKRAVDAVQAVVAIVALFTVVMLFANEPTDEAPAAGGDGDVAAVVDGAALYDRRCAGCHGDAGEGRSGPQLAGRMTSVYPDIADQLEVMREGRGGMPGFGGRLGDDELQAIAEHTREF